MQATDTTRKRKKKQWTPIPDLVSEDYNKVAIDRVIMP